MSRKPTSRSRLAPLGLACATLLALAACDSNDDGSTVQVSLSEFRVAPDRAVVSPGSVTFEVTNDGAEDHEFLVIRTDLAPDALPTEANGSYEEDGPGTELLDEIELVEPGETEDLTLELDEGSYVLICNMVEGNEAHYALGMRTAFTVG